MSARDDIELRPPSRFDLGRLLDAAEAAAPVEAVDAVAKALTEMVGAEQVSFLIADFSGWSLNRLGHTAASEDPGSRSQETAGRVTLEGTPYGAALAEQGSVLLREGDDTRVLAPVTSRGEAVGVLELVLPFEPARITVEDAGPGVPARDRERIFRRFFRLPRDEQRAVAGTGIGLAVVRDLVQRSGGRCRVEEAAGGGARFVVELPA